MQLTTELSKAITNVITFMSKPLGVAPQDADGPFLESCVALALSEDEGWSVSLTGGSGRYELPGLLVSVPEGEEQRVADLALAFKASLATTGNA
ncbi:hypothetical protein P5E67_00640 [Vibrio parahaemolyticus]|nr:hypothetical protein [Vibrio parahaemolyticus]